jgi:hypothetical protein
MAIPPDEPPPPDLIRTIAVGTLIVLGLTGVWFLVSNRGDPARPIIERQVEQQKQ